MQLISKIRKTQVKLQSQPSYPLITLFVNYVGRHKSLGVERKMSAMGHLCLTYSEQPLQFIMTAKV